MGSEKSYLLLAMQHLEAAQRLAKDDPALGRQELALALSYLRLEELAIKNLDNDVVYETPPAKIIQPEPPQLQQQQQQQQQQIQPAAKKDED